MNIFDYKREQLSSAMQQYYDFKVQNPDCVIFFQLGDFYEMFFQDAIEVANLLELTLTQKSAGLEQKVPMAGVPLSSINDYVKRLMYFNKKVAIVAQEENPDPKAKLVKRTLKKVVTPGTYQDSSSIDNNYLASVITCEKTRLAYGDIATGEMYFIDFLNVDQAFDEILKLNISEVININNSLSRFDEVFASYNITVNELTDVEHNLDQANNSLVDFFKKVNCDNVSHLKPFVELFKDDYMYLSVNTQKQLELVQTAKDQEYYGSLFWYLNNTNTAMGRRLLKNYILNPVIDLNEINRRHNLVDILTDNIILLNDITNSLKDVYDFERLIGRVSDSSILPKEMEQLKKSLLAIPNLKQTLSLLGGEFEILSDEIDPLVDIAKLLDEALLDEPNSFIKEGNIIKESFNPEVAELRGLKQNSTKWLIDFEQRQKDETGIKNLKVKYNKIFGYFIEVTNSFLNQVPEDYVRKQTMANCERYITDELKEQENKILSSSDLLCSLEYKLYIELRQTIKSYIPRLQELSFKIAFVDVMASFAKSSLKDDLVRPNFNDDGVIEVVDGFHPIVNRSVSNYIKNGLTMNADEDILLITGPNMSGKSTYMRQVIIILVMAQIGCFVPAKSANLKVFDKIYTRIGASDDLAQGKSTFMVEMSETAQALAHATTDSLLVFDELGRGTSTYDGIAIAQAILEFIHEKEGIKTLFSTHYHELIELENDLSRLRNIHVQAKQENGDLIFYHKIHPGGVEKSFGIEVAKLADLPDTVVARSRVIIDELETAHHHSHEDLEKSPVAPVNQEHELLKLKLEKIMNLDLNKLSPLEVVNFVNKFQDDM